MKFNRHTSSPCLYRKQSGFTLLEALFAFVVLAGGLIAMFVFHNTTMETTGEAKVRAEAVALAEQKLEELRSYLTEDEFDIETVSGTGLDDLVDAEGNDLVGFAAEFTRNWTVTGTNPREALVTVSWNDRTGTNQNVQLSSLIWGVAPEQAGTEFAGAIAYHGGGVPVWPVPDPLDDGTGYGTGEVDVTFVDDQGVEWAPEALPEGTVIVYYNISFTGYIDATNAILADVVLTGDAGTTGTTACESIDGDPTHTVVRTIADGVTAYGVDEIVYDYGTLLDAYGVPIPDGEDPYRYSCTITGIDHGETWTGTIIYVGQGNDAVCIPDTGTADLTFSEQSPAIVQLGIVILTNNGACNVL